ncbi:P-loop containing nucleoside triphosphate hydrolase protein [Gongronella butleri]|nr:P-loop containing nucleoside triphosphate hydrolase protein [Gongronella butleri]
MKRAKHGFVLCTQQRREAVKGVAVRVAKEQNEQLGDLIGYAVRHKTKVSIATRLLFATEGRVLQMIKNDYGPVPFSKCEVVFLDDIHEMSKQMTELLYLMKKFMARRKKLRLVLMSATPNVEQLLEYFKEYDPETMRIDGEPPNVETTHMEKPADNARINQAVNIILKHHINPEESGDFLVFVPGEADINNLYFELIHEEQSYPEPAKGPLHVIPFYAALPEENVQQVFEPIIFGRKVIVATNIAESSLTINGVNMVVDLGRQKFKNYDPRHNCYVLVEEYASKASIQQRLGRAGRTRPGKAICLYKVDEDTNVRPHFDTPAISRLNVDDTFLNLYACLGKHFDFDPQQLLDKPNPEAERRAIQLLAALNAIERLDGPSQVLPGEEFDPTRFRITKHGQKMNRLPVAPIYAHAVLVNRKKDDTMIPLLKILAMLSLSLKVFFFPVGGRNTYSRTQLAIKHSFGYPNSEHISLLQVFIAFQKQMVVTYGDPDALQDWCRENFVNFHSLQEAVLIYDQLLRAVNGILKKCFIDSRDFDRNYELDLKRTLLAAYAEQIAVICMDDTPSTKRSAHFYLVFSGATVHLCNKFRLFDIERDPPDLLMYDECLEVTNSRKIARCTAITAEMLNNCPRFQDALQRYRDKIEYPVKKCLRQVGVTIPGDA